MKTSPPENPAPPLADSKKHTCAVSGNERPKRDLTGIDDLRPSLADLIRRDHPALAADAQISSAEIRRYRTIYVEEMLKAERGEFSELDRQVIKSISNQEMIAQNTEDDSDQKWSFGERISDVIATYGGSWSFILSFGFFLAVWMVFNIYRGDPAAFDPYPFILLNLVLSTIAAIQAPIIMMSQRRQETKDRRRALNDYRVNLKAELEIRHLHEKLDHLITKQWQRLVEIQQMQLEIMNEGASGQTVNAEAKAAHAPHST